MEKTNTPRPVGRPRGPNHTITHRHVAFVAGILAGKTQKKAAQDAGFFAQTATKLMRNPLVIEELARQRQIVRARTGYDAEAMMNELDAAITHAKETENAGAYVKAIELKGKLHGLLIERVDQRQVAAFSINISGIDDQPIALPAPAEPLKLLADERLEGLFDE